MTVDTPLREVRRVIPIQNGSDTDFITEGGDGGRCFTPKETPKPQKEGAEQENKKRKGGGGGVGNYISPVGSKFSTEELLLILDIDAVFLASLAYWQRLELKDVAEEFNKYAIITADRLKEFARRIRAVARKFGITLPTGFQEAVF